VLLSYDSRKVACSSGDVLCSQDRPTCRHYYVYNNCVIEGAEEDRLHTLYEL
jgi:hypothetical protein